MRLAQAMAGFRAHRLISLISHHGSVGFNKIGIDPATIQIVDFGLRVSARGAHTHSITENINYITNDSRQLKLDGKTFKLTSQEARPLCVIMSWMMAKTRHLFKYSSIYLDMGYDVVTVTCSPIQLMLPTRGSQDPATIQIVDFGLRVSARGAHTHSITENINYITNDSRQLKLDGKTFKLTSQEARPLCVIMSWMMAKTRHLFKYSSIYLDMGYDVVTVTCSPIQLMLPTRGSQLVAADLLKFLEVNNDHNPLVVHGFSVGAYVWAELLVHALKDLERYQSVLDRVTAQVWDSPTCSDVEEIPVGLSLALFPNNKLLHKLVSAYARIHVQLLLGVYLTATLAYHNTPCHAPALFLVSRTDPVGTEKRSRRAHDMMTDAGMKCNWKCWDESPHVQHYNRHPEEYLAALFSHLRDCGLLQLTQMKVHS